MNAINLKDPISRGLEMGAASQGIAVAGMRQEKNTLLCSSTLISISIFKHWVESIASGGL